MISLCFFCTAIAYLLGSINSAVIVSKIFGKGDIRSFGSGNAGATNTLRVLGKKAAVFVVIGDFLKGLAAVLAAKYAFVVFKIQGDPMTAQYFAALGVIIGHIYPLYFGFKGGKGIMTSLAVLFVLDWEIAVILLVTFIIIVAATKFVSLGSCISSGLFPILVLMFHGNDKLFIALSFILCAMMLYNHRENIKRLANGCETPIHF